jgi:outer membrane protein OmpA-like peptidoglycan-associated protein
MKRFYFLIVVLSINIYSQINVEVKLTDTKYTDASISYEILSDSKIKINILDKNKEPLKDLKISDFELTQNGYKAKIKNVVPLSQAQESSIRLFLCLDNSSSISSYKKRILEILDNLINKMPKASNIELIFFDETEKPRNFVTSKGVPLKVYKKNFLAENQKVKNAYQVEYSENLTERTYLYDQIYAAFYTANREKNRTEDIFYIVLSDGRDIGSEMKRQDVFSEYKNGKLFLIDFDLGFRNKFLVDLAEMSNGNYYRPQNVGELENFLSQIGDKVIFSGYEISFESQMPPQLFLSKIFEIKNNQSFDLSEIFVEEVRSREIFPLLNYVFFEKNSSELNGKYVKLSQSETTNFQELLLPPAQMSIYYNTLNIIGSRLRQYSDSKITLTGCNDNVLGEKNNLNLSKERAEVLKNYLVEIWNIEPDRISVQTKNLPPKPSNNTTEAGQSENRRVEISATDERILEVVEAFAFTKVTRPEILRLNYKVQSSYNIKSYNMVVKQSNRLIFEQDFEGALPKNLSWNIPPALAGKIVDSSDFIIYLTAKDDRGYESTPVVSRVSINFLSKEKKALVVQNDRFIEKVSLVLFEFNSSDLDLRNQRALLKLNESIKPTSAVIVKGYTDDTGSEEINLKLSQDRSKNALVALKNLLRPSTENLNNEGLGKSAPMYNNNLPEGRFYNRTCQIVIETEMN